MILQGRGSRNIIAVTALLLLASCAGGPKASRSNPNAPRPETVEHEGTLTPVNGIARVISGKTLVLRQPWVGRANYELRDNPIYFRADGYADSGNWVDIPWTVQGNELCMSDKGFSNCYVAYQDDVRQAYVQDRATGLLAKVQSIEPGDPHHVRAAYEARQRQLAAQQQMAAAFAGMLFEAMLSGGGGGGQSQDDYMLVPGNSGGGSSSPSYTPPMGGETGIYGSCHGVGC